MACACHPISWEAKLGGMLFRQKVSSYLKNNQSRGWWSSSSGTRVLSSNCEALSSNPSTAKALGLILSTNQQDVRLQFALESYGTRQDHLNK
jgi:hypothetical protein